MKTHSCSRVRRHGFAGHARSIPLLALLVLTTVHGGISPVNAQGVSINATNAPPDSSAMLDVSSPTKGILIPRMTQVQRLAISSPATGLIIYQSDTLPGLYLNVGTPSSPAWMVFGGRGIAGNTFIGLGALSANTSGGSNTAAGENVLSANTTGFDNTGIGAYALSSNIGGYANVANGAGALLSNTTGVDNTASGFFTMVSNTSGNENTAYGSVALSSNSTGGQNVAVGLGALSSNTVGDSNAACGYYALSGNTSGKWNTAVGNQALLANTTGSRNTGTGDHALFSNTIGSFNSAFGDNALFSNSFGAANTACGISALMNNTSGNDNTAVGDAALGFNNTGSANTAEGEQALQQNTDGSFNTASGESALMSNTVGVGNCAVGYSAMSQNTTGNYNTTIGYSANVATGGLNNATAIGAGAVVNASNKIRLGDGSVTVIEGQVAYTFTSDSTKKENHLPVDGEAALRKISEMNIGSWNYKGQDPKQFRHYGPMAQEFYSAFGHDDIGQIGNDTTICSGDLAGISVIAIQALERRNSHEEQLRREVSTLRYENAQLRKSVDLLKAAQATTALKMADIQAVLRTIIGSSTVAGRLADRPQNH